MEGLVLSDQLNLHYELFAVIQHFGGIGGGHCMEDCFIVIANLSLDTALARNPNDQLWYEFDDSRVSPVSPVQVAAAQRQAYMLFYERKLA